MKFTPKSLSAVILTITVCLVILTMFARFCFYPPGTVLDETRDKMFQLVTFIAGIISGWVLHGDTKPKDEEEEGKKVEKKEEKEKKV